MTFTVHVDFHFDLFAGETTILELLTLSRINDLESNYQSLLNRLTIGLQKTKYIPLNGCPELYILYISKNYTFSGKGEIKTAY